MLKWMGLLPRQLQNTIDSHFRQVFDLAQHSGMEALLEAAATRGDLSLAAAMPRDVGLYAKSMWAWLHRRDIFKLATRIHQVENIAWWRKRWDLPRHAPDVSDAALARLQKRISELLLLSQGRGQTCTVDTMSRLDGTDYFLAHPDDFVWNYFAHGEDGKLGAQAACPTFSIAFAYRRDEGSLEMSGRVPQALKSQLEEIFAEAVLGVSLGPWDPSACYQLDHLKDRSFRLETDPEDRLRVSILGMRLALRNSGRRLFVGVDVNNPSGNIHKALEECLNREHVPLSDVMVTRVTFCFEFLPLAGRVPGLVKFDVGRPNTCTLRNVRADYVELIAKYLRLWRIDLARRLAVALAATGA